MVLVYTASDRYSDVDILPFPDRGDSDTSYTKHLVLVEIQMKKSLLKIEYFLPYRGFGITEKYNKEKDKYTTSVEYIGEYKETLNPLFIGVLDKLTFNSVDEAKFDIDTLYDIFNTCEKEIKEESIT